MATGPTVVVVRGRRGGGGAVSRVMKEGGWKGPAAGVSKEWLGRTGKRVAAGGRWTADGEIADGHERRRRSAAAEREVDRGERRQWGRKEEKEKDKGNLLDR